MRNNIVSQLSLIPPVIDHPHARELSRVSAILDTLPLAAERVARDLARGTEARRAGRAGMSGEQVLRAALLKQMHAWSYDDLAFHLCDSETFRSFCRIGMMDAAPKRSCLAENIKRVEPSTFEEVNRLVVGHAKKKGVESGSKIRVDSTVIDANIHHPLDSRLLFDVVRVLTRLLKKSTRHSSRIKYSNHTKRAKRRSLGILNARSMAHRVPLYRELLELTQRTITYASHAVTVLGTLASPRAWRAADRLQRVIELGNKVVDQTRRRVFEQASVPATEKIVSLFEPHTDVIVKDRRQTLYGHKVFLNVGASGMILDLLLERGNPADSTRVMPMLERHRALMGKAPSQAAFDAGFTSKANIENARHFGVKDASFAKKGSIDVLAGGCSPERHKLLQRFRAGVEGIISFTKRCFGFGRCFWRGYQSFQAYAWASVLSTNLMLLARQTMH